MLNAIRTNWPQFIVIGVFLLQWGDVRRSLTELRRDVEWLRSKSAPVVVLDRARPITDSMSNGQAVFQKRRREDTFLQTTDPKHAAISGVDSGLAARASRVHVYRPGSGDYWRKYNNGSGLGGLQPQADLLDPTGHKPPTRAGPSGL